MTTAAILVHCCAHTRY